MIEEKSYVPNRDLELTPEMEVIRLRKVLEEKNALIAKFRRYDEERKAHYRRFEQNYAMMEERFNELLDAINACDFDEGTIGFYKAVVMRLYKGKVAADLEKSVFQVAYSGLSKLSDRIDDLGDLVECVGNVQKRSELLDAVRQLKFRCNGIASTFKKNMDALR